MHCNKSNEEAGSQGSPIGRSKSRLHRFANEVGDEDARSRYREEEADNNVTQHNHGLISSSNDDRSIIAFEPDDRENPYNWSEAKKALIVFASMVTVVNSTIGSALPSNAIPYFTKEWGVTSQMQKSLPIAIYLVGYVLGPIVWAPLSEQFGRRLLFVGTFFMFCIWTLACALAPNWPAFLVFRLLVGVFASAPIALVVGIMADIYGEYRTRGRAMATSFVATIFGPLFAPIISGFCSPAIGWRWAFWIGLAYAGLSMTLLLLVPETYGPIILVRRARLIRSQDPKANVVAPHELEAADLLQLAVRVLTRPARMLFFELIVSTTCFYLALCYGIFYMTFQAYPIIFQELYGLSPGIEGLCFLPIGAGALCALPVFFGWDAYLEKAQAEGRPWAKKEEYRRVPLACVGGPLFVISLFWLGWFSREEIPFWVPMLAGIPFGIGFQLIFMALLNYVTDAYEIFAASANAASTCTRSVLGTVLPFACTPMFRRLGISGACSLLGGLSFLFSIIPFVFIWKGERIRAGSRFCIALRQDKEEMERRVEEQRREEERGGGGDGGGRNGVVEQKGEEEA